MKTLDIPKQRPPIRLTPKTHGTLLELDEAARKLGETEASDFLMVDDVMVSTETERELRVEARRRHRRALVRMAKRLAFLEQAIRDRQMGGRQFPRQPADGLPRVSP